MSGREPVSPQAPGTSSSCSTHPDATCDEFKLLVIGDRGVGKTSLLTRFADDTFTDSYTTTAGVDSVIRHVTLDGKTIKLKIWDSAAQERFRSVTAALYRDTHGIMVIYDVTKQESFNNVNNWLDKIEEHLGKGATSILVGNRCDETTNKVVDYTTAKEFADQRGIPFMETSAKDGTNVEQAFITLAAKVKN